VIGVFKNLPSRIKRMAGKKNGDDVKDPKNSVS
jgi:hypothetical protein